MKSLLHPVFVYGSLLRGLHNHGVIARSRLVCPVAATQKPFTLIDSTNGYPYATCLERSEEPAATPLCGELYLVDDATMSALDELEQHPTYYERSRVALTPESWAGSEGAAGDGTAWMYLLVERTRLEELDRNRKVFATVEPLGDWRKHLVSQLFGRGCFAVFNYGSNGLKQLQERCKNRHLIACEATLIDHLRCFAGASQRWEGGGVASIIPAVGQTVQGSVTFLTEQELCMLDRFELGAAACDAGADPFGTEGVYRRQRVRVMSGGDEIDALAYVKNDLTWQAPPGDAYLHACWTHMRQFWQKSEIEIHNGVGEVACAPWRPDETRSRRSYKS